jgi:ribose transport system ATP-binding protein
MSEIFIEMKNISKSFPGVKAVDSVDLKVRKGEVHAIVGENGAGKSTLMKILNGVYKKDDGEIFVNGKKVEINSTVDAQSLGISTIYQEFNLSPKLSVAENIYLGRLEAGRLGNVKWKKVYKKTEELLKSLHFDIDKYRIVEELTIAEMQMVEIAKSLSQNAKLLVMDEPSATLTKDELEKLYSIIEKIKKDGVTVIYISHRLEEIFQIADTVTVLRDGKRIDSTEVSSISKEELIERMVGRKIENEFPERITQSKEVLLEVKDLVIQGSQNKINFNLRRSEILGIAGIVGSGRSEIIRAIFGADKKVSGNVFIDGKKCEINCPKESKELGIGLVPEDRKLQGLFLDFEIYKNITSTKLKSVSKNSIIKPVLELKAAKKYSDLLNIKAVNLKQKVLFLSGGNQQKVVLAKWLFADVDILIMDEPTRGIDVGSKYEIYTIMNQLIESGKSIILISSDLPELIAMSDRIIVVNNGSIMGELSKEEISAENVMELAIK